MVAQALVIIIPMIRAPLLMMLVCCLWGWLRTGFVAGQGRKLLCLGLAGYTALIIIITIHTNPMLAPQFAVERCSEIVIGIVSAISTADLPVFAAFD
ncbi:FUSC family protein [Escherichia coli]|nr:FUSC family protein [Escherichia coli]